MSINIPEKLKKYVKLAQDGTLIDQFKCPVPGCDYTTRLGPGAVRMHILINADPMSGNRYNPDHENYLRANESELSLDLVRELANFPYRSISYKKE
jgi:hypothetical protein